MRAHVKCADFHTDRRIQGRFGIECADWGGIALMGGLHESELSLSFMHVHSSENPQEDTLCVCVCVCVCVVCVLVCVRTKILLFEDEELSSGLVLCACAFQ